MCNIPIYRYIVNPIKKFQLRPRLPKFCYTKNTMADTPKFLYHGTVTANIEEFEPRKRFTPGNAENVPPRIYATDRPVFAVMHAFPWSSDEGIDIVERHGKLYLQVPEQLKKRLDQPIYIYKLNGDSFVLTEEEESGNTYHSEKPKIPESVESFNSVTEAIHHYGGMVEFI